MRSFFATCAVFILAIGTWIDAWLIWCVEKFAHRVQLLTGYDCFDLRRACNAIAGICYVWAAILSALVGSSLGMPRLLNALVTAMLLLLALIFLGYSAVSTPREEFFRSAAFLNDAKIGAFDIVMRLSGTAFLVGAASFAPTPIRDANLAIVAAWYFGACNPLPPCAGKIRQWVREIMAGAAAPAREGA